MFQSPPITNPMQRSEEGRGRLCVKLCVGGACGAIACVGVPAAGAVCRRWGPWEEWRSGARLGPWFEDSWSGSGTAHWGEHGATSAPAAAPTAAPAAPAPAAAGGGRLGLPQNQPQELPTRFTSALNHVWRVSARPPSPCARMTVGGCEAAGTVGKECTREMRGGWFGFPATTLPCPPSTHKHTHTHTRTRTDPSSPHSPPHRPVQPLLGADTPAQCGTPYLRLQREGRRGGQLLVGAGRMSESEEEAYQHQCDVSGGQ